MPKKKLLVIVGAGASVHLGIPGVAAVGQLLQKKCLERYPLVVDSGRSIYDWLVEQIVDYRRSVLKPAFVQPPNFEEVLYTALQLGALYPHGLYTSAIGAFIGMRHSPEVAFFGQRRPLQGFDWTQLGSFMADTIIETFREACRDLEPAMSAKMQEMRNFFGALSASHEIAVVTLNYDDAIWRILPDLETGFDPATGLFEDRRLFERRDWGCFVHLHGSVHFDMRSSANRPHEIMWVQDLGATFSQNAAGRSGVYTTEGPVFPQSVLVAGYGKTQQILRRPFRSYYSEVDRLVSESDALLSLGYGFADAHLNAALDGFRDARNRPAVLIDWANDDAMSAAHAYWGDGRSITTALSTFRNHASRMSALGRRAPTDVQDLKRAREFDLSTDPATPLAVWYNGMDEACQNPAKVLSHL